MQELRGDEGFTVVELLIALSILSLVATALISVFATGQHLFMTVSEAERQLEEVTIIRRLLLESLGQAARVPGRGAAIAGDARRLSIRSIGPRVLAFAAPATLDLHPDDDQHGLVASWTSGLDERKAPTSRRIVEAGRQVRFSYFKHGTGWTGSWPEGAAHPALIRVTVSDGIEGDSPAELVFATRVLVRGVCDARGPDQTCGAAR
jgi:prepilin-type N-terminal cleavage/methylation domain-containing protein